jgi:hypothetical protein
MISIRAYRNTELEICLRLATFVPARIGVAVVARIIKRHPSATSLQLNNI